MLAADHSLEESTCTIIDNLMNMMDSYVESTNFIIESDICWHEEVLTMGYFEEMA